MGAASSVGSPRASPVTKGADGETLFQVGILTQLLAKVGQGASVFETPFPLASRRISFVPR